MKTNSRAAARNVSRHRIRVAFVAFFLLVRGAPALPAERADPHLLPTGVRYARNSGCSAVAIRMPPSTHSATDGNMISPKPADMPLSQGDSAICFAYATADMISQRLGTEISALDVATKYYFADPLRLARTNNRDLRLHLRGMGDYRKAIAESRGITEISAENNLARYPYMDNLEGGEEDIAGLLYNVSGLCRDKDLSSYEGYTHFSNFLGLWRKLTQLFAPTVALT